MEATESIIAYGEMLVVIKRRKITQPGRTGHIPQVWNSQLAHIANNFSFLIKTPDGRAAIGDPVPTNLPNVFFDVTQPINSLSLIYGDSVSSMNPPGGKHDNVCSKLAPIFEQEASLCELFDLTIILQFDLAVRDELTCSNI